MQTFDKCYVVDTNIILENAANILTISQNAQNLVVVPETVLDEIDAKKSGFEEINFQAREFARILEDFSIVKSTVVEGHQIIRMSLKDSCVIDFISKDVYDVKSSSQSANILNDRKILEIAKFAKQNYSEVIFLSMDMMARMRSISMNIPTQSLQGGANETDKNFVFETEIEIDFNDLESLSHRDIYDLHLEHAAHNYSYLFKVRHSDQIVLATVENGRVVPLDEEELRKQSITPMNKEQLFFAHAIAEHHYKIVIVEAKAGSGKTLLALSGAMKLISQKDYRKILYIRNSIESLDKGEDVGYLPGFEEKFRIYNHPLMDSLDYIVRLEFKRKSAKSSYSGQNEPDEEQIAQRVQIAKQKYAIETMWVGEMRGRTISDAVVIIDEAQNMSNKTMQMVLSRLDDSCKVIIVGSNKQIDNFYINKHTNALTTLLKSAYEDYEGVNVFALRLKKVLRGPITEWAEKIFSK